MTKSELRPFVLGATILCYTHDLPINNGSERFKVFQLFSETPFKMGITKRGLVGNATLVFALWTLVRGGAGSNNE